MSYWVKHFADSTHEVGKDDDIRQGKASWSRGRLKGITAATLGYSGAVVVVPGTNIWQKDKYGAAFNLPPSRISRSLGVMIQEQDVGKNLFLRQMGNDVYHIKITDQAVIGTPTVVEPEHVGQWAVVTIQRNGNPKFTIEDRYRV